MSNFINILSVVFFAGAGIFLIMSSLVYRKTKYIIDKKSVIGIDTRQLMASRLLFMVNDLQFDLTTISVYMYIYKNSINDAYMHPQLRTMHPGYRQCNYVSPVSIAIELKNIGFNKFALFSERAVINSFNELIKKRYLIYQNQFSGKLDEEVLLIRK